MKPAILGHESFNVWFSTRLPVTTISPQGPQVSISRLESDQEPQKQLRETEQRRPPAGKQGTSTKKPGGEPQARKRKRQANGAGHADHRENQTKARGKTRRPPQKKSGKNPQTSQNKNGERNTKTRGKSRGPQKNKKRKKKNTPAAPGEPWTGRRVRRPNPKGSGARLPDSIDASVRVAMVAEEAKAQGRVERS